MSPPPAAIKTPQPLLLATTNPGKQRELGQLFADLAGVRLLVPTDVGGLPPVIEDGDSFESNAAKKAREIAAATGVAVVSDDSGLEVDALGGRPGVRSARFAGDHSSDDDNNRKLVAELAAVRPERRSARYRVALAFVDPRPGAEASATAARGTASGAGSGPFIHIVQASCEGRIRLSPSGHGGFGYDPYFEPEGYHCTMAELSAEEKNRISHRARAARTLHVFLLDYFCERGMPSL